MPPDDFILRLFFLVNYQGVATAIETNDIKVTVSDPPLSAWDPKLLFAQLIVGLLVTGIGYWISNAYVSPYFNDQPRPVQKEAVATKSGVAVGAKGYDESWIPQHHLNSNVKKSRKVK